MKIQKLLDKESEIQQRVSELGFGHLLIHPRGIENEVTPHDFIVDSLTDENKANLAQLQNDLRSILNHPGVNVRSRETIQSSEETFAHISAPQLDKAIQLSQIKSKLPNDIPEIDEIDLWKNIFGLNVQQPETPQELGDDISPPKEKKQKQSPSSEVRNPVLTKEQGVTIETSGP